MLKRLWRLMRRGSAAAETRKESELADLADRLIDSAQATGNIICLWKVGGSGRSFVAIKGTGVDILMTFSELAAHFVRDKDFPVEMVALAASQGIATGMAAKMGRDKGETQAEIPTGMMQ